MGSAVSYTKGVTPSKVPNPTTSTDLEVTVKIDGPFKRLFKRLSSPSEKHTPVAATIEVHPLAVNSITSNASTSFPISHLNSVSAVICTKPIIPIADLQFHPFPRLPIELRLRIWRLAIPTTRKFIEIASHRIFLPPPLPTAIATACSPPSPEDECDDYADEDLHFRWTSSSSDPPPTLLFTTVESRAEAVRSGLLLLANPWWPNSGKAYLNLPHDVLCCRFMHHPFKFDAFLALLPKEVYLVKTVAVTEYVWRAQWCDHVEVLGRFKGLEELCIVKNDRSQRSIEGFMSYEEGAVGRLLGFQDAVALVKDVKRAFEIAKKRDPEWKVPVLKLGRFVWVSWSE